MIKSWLRVRIRGSWAFRLKLQVLGNLTKSNDDLLQVGAQLHGAVSQSASRPHSVYIFALELDRPRSWASWKSHLPDKEEIRKKKKHKKARRLLWYQRPNDMKTQIMATGLSKLITWPKYRHLIAWSSWAQTPGTHSRRSFSSRYSSFWMQRWDKK